MSETKKSIWMDVYWHLPPRPDTGFSRLRFGSWHYRTEWCSTVLYSCNIRFSCQPFHISPELVYTVFASCSMAYCTWAHRSKLWKSVIRRVEFGQCSASNQLQRKSRKTVAVQIRKRKPFSLNRTIALRSGTDWLILTIVHARNA